MSLLTAHHTTAALRGAEAGRIERTISCIAAQKADRTTGSIRTAFEAAQACPGRDAATETGAARVAAYHATGVDTAVVLTGEAGMTADTRAALKAVAAAVVRERAADPIVAVARERAHRLVERVTGGWGAAAHTWCPAPTTGLRRGAVTIVAAAFTRPATADVGSTAPGAILGGTAGAYVPRHVARLAAAITGAVATDAVDAVPGQALPPMSAVGANDLVAHTAPASVAVGPTHTVVIIRASAGAGRAVAVAFVGSALGRARRLTGAAAAGAAWGGGASLAGALCAAPLTLIGRRARALLARLAGWHRTVRARAALAARAVAAHLPAPTGQAVLRLVRRMDALA